MSIRRYAVPVGVAAAIGVADGYLLQGDYDAGRLSGQQPRASVLRERHTWLAAASLVGAFAAQQAGAPVVACEGAAVAGGFLLGSRAARLVYGKQ